MSDGSNSQCQFGLNTQRNTAWCSEIDSLMSLEAPELHASSDVREPISLHQAVHRGICWIKYAIKKTKTTTTMLNFLVKKVHKTGQKAYLSKAWPFYHPQKQNHSWKILRGSKLEKEERKGKRQSLTEPPWSWQDFWCQMSWIASNRHTSHERGGQAWKLGLECETKIAHFDDSVTGEQNVIQFHITVDHAVLAQEELSLRELPAPVKEHLQLSRLQMNMEEWWSSLPFLRKKKRKNWHIDQTKNTAQPRRGIKPRVPLITSRTL